MSIEFDSARSVIPDLTDYSNYGNDSRDGYYALADSDRIFKVRKMFFTWFRDREQPASNGDGDEQGIILIWPEELSEFLAKTEYRANSLENMARFGDEGEQWYYEPVVFLSDTRVRVLDTILDEVHDFKLNSRGNLEFCEPDELSNGDFR